MVGMRQKIFWAVTILFAAFMAFSGFSGALSESGVKGFADLGYPDYFAIIIGVAKVLGALALVARRFPTLTEWAYAGFAFDLIGAAWSILAAGGGLMSLSVLPFAALLVASYWLAPKHVCRCACCQGGACKDCHI